MDLPSKILIKRRNQGDPGPPSTLLNGELSFNEVDDTLYYGKGVGSNGNCSSIIQIGGGHTKILKDSYISTTETLNDIGEFLIIMINGQKKAIKLFDVM